MAQKYFDWHWILVWKSYVIIFFLIAPPQTPKQTFYCYQIYNQYDVGSAQHWFVGLIKSQVSAVSVDPIWASLPVFEFYSTKSWAWGGELPLHAAAPLLHYISVGASAVREI